jgi:hypothetical protein
LKLEPNAGSDAASIEANEIQHLIIAGELKL